MTAKAKLLEVLPKNIPYELEPEIEHWEEEPVMQIGLAIVSRKPYFTKALLGKGLQSERLNSELGRV